MFILLGCNQQDINESIVAKVGNSTLLIDDIPDFSLKSDSATLRSTFIDAWIKKQLLVEKALENLTESQSKFDKQLEDYRSSLLIYAFENQIVKQKLDTTISKRELKLYYKENKENFKLREDYVKGRFVQIINTAPKVDSLRTWLHGNEEQLNLKLLQYCSQFATNCLLDTTAWVPFTKIKELSHLPPNKNLYLSIGKNDISDSTQSLLAEVYGLKTKGEIAPLSILEEEIKTILLNKRKIQLINNVKEEIFEAATLNEDYEIYY